MEFNLDKFADSLAVAIAMQADEQAVGVDGKSEGYWEWHDRLHEAIDRGLEAVVQRVTAHENAS